MAALEIIVPFYNEAPRLEPAVHAFAEALDRARGTSSTLAARFWWADDGSTDNSRSRLGDAVDSAFPPRLATHVFIGRENNRGKGSILRFAMAQCLREAAPDSIVAFWDADGELDPVALFDGARLLLDDEADVVFGARVFSSSLQLREIPPAVARRAANLALTWVSNRFSGLALDDVHCCARLVRANLLSQLPLTSTGFDFEAEFAGVVGRLRGKLGLRVRQVAVPYRPRTLAEGKKIGISDVLPQIGQAIRCRYLLGKF